MAVVSAITIRNNNETEFDLYIAMHIWCTDALAILGFISSDIVANICESNDPFEA